MKDAIQKGAVKVLAYVGWTCIVLFVANLVRTKVPGYELHVQTMSGAIVLLGKDLFPSA